MAGSDMAAWRRQNSDVVTVDLQLVDGTHLKGTILVQREKSLKDVFSSTEPFIDFECMINGEMVIAKTAVATVRQSRKPSADQIEKRLKTLESSDSFAILKLPKTADLHQVREAYLKLTRMYHPDRYVGTELPAEVREYMDAMIRRVNAAYGELNALLGSNRKMAEAA